MPLRLFLRLLSVVEAQAAAAAQVVTLAVEVALALYPTG
jgi:hypothetical protein